MTDLHTELLGVVENAITNHPRSLQTRIGPSEIGHPCARRLAYKLAGAPEVNSRGVPWKPTVGTAVHTWMDETFTKANEALPGYDQGDIRYWTEVRVDVGEILGQSITGSCDLRIGDTVIDYKIVGDEQLRKYKKHGPGDQYRIQAHLYGRGWTRSYIGGWDHGYESRNGVPIRTVGVWFLPRNQELRQNYLWTEPYDEQIAIDALTRVEGIAKLTTALGTKAAALLPKAESYCRYCPFFKPGSDNPADGCDGVIEPVDPAKAFAGLIAPTTPQQVNA
ncbi:hypothetical protein [Actinomadura rudentiformis]|uniref:PD-(D/E)XK nuclease family protein n=1 Tax=Actinomadura rudentiformis TaxID=359158 RepID=A0A6H9YJY2_9ACTN|nr:hypothetical protein [Actinomadura rudentiformis]KAB2347315.1 hypothetical protein F8566_20090 [Actinomadura rudentiformis]